MSMSEDKDKEMNDYFRDLMMVVQKQMGKKQYLGINSWKEKDK